MELVPVEHALGGGVALGEVHGDRTPQPGRCPLARILAATAGLRISSPTMAESPAISHRERLGVFLRGNGRQILFWLILVVFVTLGLRRHWKGSVIAAGVVLWGMLTHIFGVAFALFLGWVGAFPLAGPVIIKLLTWPLFLLINGAAFFTSLVGVNIGKGRQVFEARVAATILMTGVLVGFLLGKLF